MRVHPPPRKNRLNDAVLTFLVAASAAFFVCAPAGAIEITAMTPSSSETIAGDSSHYIMLYTDVGYAFVQWFVKGADGTEKLVRTNIGNGLGTFDYLSSYDYAGLGSTTGNKVTVKAVAYRNAGNHDDHDTETVEITVWEPIRVLLYTQGKSVEKEEVTFTARTNIPASHVIFTIDGGDPIRVENGGTNTSLKHTFGDGQGSREGVEHTIEAVAYATVAGKEISDDDSKKFIVYANLGFIWRFSSVYIRSIEKQMDEHEYMLRTIHDVAYYNDTGRAFPSKIITNLGWLWSPNDPDNMGGVAQNGIQYGAEVGYAYYAGKGPIYRNLSWSLTHRHFYGVRAYTSVQGGQGSKAEVDSGPGVRYDRVDRNLPPVGQSEWVWNSEAP